MWLRGLSYEGLGLGFEAQSFIRRLENERGVLHRKTGGYWPLVVKN